MTRYSALAIAITLMLLASAGRAADYPTVDVTFTAPAESLRYVTKAVKLTLLGRQWKVDKETETSIQATLEKPDEKLWVSVLITFDTSKAAIAYVDSKVVHRSPESEPSTITASTYRSWVNNLAKDLPVQLERVRILLN